MSCANFNAFRSLPPSMLPIFFSCPVSFPYCFPSLKSFNGVSLFKSRVMSVNSSFRIKCSATTGLSGPPSPGEDLLSDKSGLPAFARVEILPNRKVGEASNVVSVMNYEIQMRVDAVRAMWESIEDGWLNISAYDTAWVALVEDINGSGSPRFPSCLQWIVDNQLSDGSWGDRAVFLSYDRLLSTLACVIALRHWNVHPEKSRKGIEFFKENLERLAKEDPANMPVDFEMIFPSLIEMARNLNIEVPHPSTYPLLKQIYAMKNEKVKRASQVLFPGEKIMEDAKRFSHDFLTEKRAANQLGDKWVIAKDIAGEIGFGLDLPWYAILPRIETRFYLDQYGGANDVWISKALYRLPRVNNEIYLELGKLDYNNCQALLRTEWTTIQEWYFSHCGMDHWTNVRGMHGPWKSFPLKQSNLDWQGLLPCATL